MSIKVIVNSGKSMVLSGMACKLEAGTIKEDLPELEAQFNYCGFECPYKELVLADLTNPTEVVYNDKSAVLIDLKDENGSFEIYLIKPNGQEELLDDDTYGTFFDKGFNSDNPLKGGFLINWNNVLLLLGHGGYKIRTEIINFGRPPVIRTSHFYDLNHYSETKANNSVKVESIQNGLIENGIDYTGLEWYMSFRIHGSFGDKSRQTEVSRYQNTSRVLQDNQIINLHNYNLTLKNIPQNVADHLIDDVLLGDKVFLTDYRIFSGNQYKRIDCKFLEVSESNNDQGVRNGSYIIEMQDSNQGTIKRSITS